MNKKVLFLLTAGAGVVAVKSLLKTEKLNNEDREKVEEYKEYLESKGYTVSKYNSPINGFNLLSVSSLPTYYKVAKTVAKYVL